MRLTDRAYEFHTLLYRASHNEILARFLDHLHTLSFRMCYLVKVNSGRKNPLFIAAKKAHQEAYGEDPGPFFTEAYSAALALLNAIEKGGSTEFEAITQALRSEYVDTPLGSISFDQNGDAIGIGFSVYQVKNGAFTTVQ